MSTFRHRRHWLKPKFKTISLPGIFGTCGIRRKAYIRKYFESGPCFLTVLASKPLALQLLQQLSSLYLSFFLSVWQVRCIYENIIINNMNREKPLASQLKLQCNSIIGNHIKLCIFLIPHKVIGIITQNSQNYSIPSGRWEWPILCMRCTVA